LKLSSLKGLGPKSQACLNEVGIFTREDLEAIGAVGAFLKLKEECATKPSMNFLYAMVGALEGKHWAKIAKEEKSRLLMELDDYQALEAIFSKEPVKAK